MEHDYRLLHNLQSIVAVVLLIFLVFLQTELLTALLKRDE